MRLFLSGFLGAIALAQSPADPKPDFPPSREVHITPSTMKEESASVTSRPDYWTARGFGLKEILARIYKVDDSRVVLPASLNPKTHYDFSLVFPNPEDDATIDHLVEQAIRTHFGISIAREKRTLDVYIMTAPHGLSSAMHELPARTSGSVSSGVTITTTSISADNAAMEDISQMLEQHLQRIVLDETGLKARYEFEIKEIPRGTEGFLKTLSEKLGLNLTRSPRELDMVVVTVR